MKQQNYTIKFNNKENILTGSFIYETDSSNLTGKAKVTLPYTDDNWALGEEGIKVEVYAGVGEVDYLFNGTTKRANRVRNDILVELLDNGNKFKRPFTGTYKNEPFKNVVEEIATQCEHIAVFDKVPEYVLQKEISRSNSAETSVINSPSGYTIGDTESTVTGAFHPSCDICIDQYLNQYYVTSVKKTCPKCNSDSIKYDRIGDEFYCDTCGTIYCGVCGYEKVSFPVYRLSIVYGPVLGDTFNLSPTYSSSGVTCEDELKSICKANNQYVYITPKGELVVRDFNGFPYPDYVISSIDIEEKSLSQLKDLTNKIKGVTVEYGAGTLTMDLKSITDDPNKDRLYFSKKDLDKASAQKFGNNILFQQLTDLQTDIEVVLPLKAGYIPGKWLQIPFFDINYPLNITYCHHTITPSTMNTEIRLRLYPDVISQEDLYTNLNVTELTKDTILKTAASFEFSNICSTGDCIRQKKYGNTIAMSQYLYNMLKKIGLRVRIMEYNTGILNGTKQYIQIQKNSDWVDLEYEDFAQGFVPDNQKTNLRVVKS